MIINKIDNIVCKFSPGTFFTTIIQNAQSNQNRYDYNYNSSFGCYNEKADNLYFIS